MAAIPGFLLKKLYAKGSLRNTPEGCEFDIQNTIGTAAIGGLSALTIDGESYGAEDLQVLLPGGGIRRAETITPDAPSELPVGTRLTLRLPGVNLEPGKHQIQLCFQVQGLGNLGLKVADTVRDVVASPAPVEMAAVDEGPQARHIKVAILGAGSAVFAKQLMTDLLCAPGLEEGTFALVDVDAERLELAHQIGQRLVKESGRAWSVEASTDRARVLPGCHYLISTIEVAGLRNVQPDYEIPLKYGVDQCIGDTIGPGGIFKMLRTGPAWLEILRDVERFCPHAVVMNYTNPMSALTLLALKATRLSVVGLCHSVQGTSAQLANYLDVPHKELVFRCAGINHMAWFTELAHRGEDLYPRLRQIARDPEIYEADPVRFEVMLQLGAFVTESSGHFSEYVPYFRKRQDLLQRYTGAGYLGESGFYAGFWPGWRKEADNTIRSQLAGKGEIVLRRSTEYASAIVGAIEMDTPAVIHGNVLNRGMIDNLPGGGCVEVPVLVDGTGMHPIHFGPLPTHLAALNAGHMFVHDLMVQAVLERDREAALRALMLDPLTAAVCSLEEIRCMFDEMWEAEREDLLAFE